MKKTLVQKQMIWFPDGGHKPMDCAQFNGWGAPPRNAALNGFLDGLNLKELLEMAGTTVVQLQQAKNGQPVYVNAPNGQQQNITPILMSKLEEQAQRQQTSVDNMIKMMQMQMMNNNNNKPPQKDNTLLYVGLGAGALVLIGGIYFLTKKK